MSVAHSITFPAITRYLGKPGGFMSNTTGFTLKWHNRISGLFQDLSALEIPKKSPHTVVPFMAFKIDCDSKT